MMMPVSVRTFPTPCGTIGQSNFHSKLIIDLAELVVITPGSEKEVGVHLAGDLPIAEDPQFPKSKTIFLSNLISHGEAQAQKAMLKAMRANNE